MPVEIKELKILMSVSDQRKSEEIKGAINPYDEDRIVKKVTKKVLDQLERKSER